MSTAAEAVTLRRPTLADHQTLAGLHLMSFQRTYGPMLRPHERGLFSLEERCEVWQRVLSQPAPHETVWLAEESRGPLGLLWTGASADNDAPSHMGAVHALHVHPDRHRRGIGRLLLGMGMSDLADQGFSSATLWVLGDNLGAQAFYRAQGWAMDGASKIAPIGGRVGLPVVREIRFRYLSPLR